MNYTTLSAQAEKMLEAFKKAKCKLVTAESCTGGLLAAAITEVPGSSSVLERGFVVYSNDAKIDLLTVPTFFIEEYGAVSAEVAIAMAEGALIVSRAQISVSITGIAGPEGATEQKPIGTVHIASARTGKDTVHKAFSFKGDRAAIREQAVVAAMAMVMEWVK